MIMDERTEFCDATAMDTGGTGRALIGDVVDTGGDGINDVDQLYLCIQVTTTFTSGGSATVSFILASDAAAAIADDGSASEHVVSEDIALATLVAGYERFFPIPPGSYERYMGILQNVGTAALTAGAINAFLTPQSKMHKSFPDAVN